MRRIAVLLCLALPAVALGQTAGPSAVDPGHIRPGDVHPASLVGDYDGRQTEVAARLRLGEDGHFVYQFSYGSLDEEAQGTWRFDGRQVLLDGDPVRPPRIVPTGQSAAPAHELHVTLDLPRGLLQQYFDVRVRLADGTLVQRQFTEEGLTLTLAEGEVPVSIVVDLPAIRLESEPLPLTIPAGGGATLAFRFDANDIGKVAFTGTPLAVDNGDLLLIRYDRRLRFRKIG